METDAHRPRRGRGYRLGNAAVCRALAARPARPRPACAEIVVLDSGLSEADVEKRPYASYVAECADLLMEFGTDRYGDVHRPLLVTILDVRSAPARSLPPNRPRIGEATGVRASGNREGADLLVDQSTIEAFYLLTTLTGDAKYAAFAERYLRGAS